MEKKLYRDEFNKKLAGVCAGLADYLSIDVAVVRVIFVLAVFMKGVGIIPYIVLWIALPKKPYGFINNPNIDYSVPPQPPFSMKPPKKASSAGLIAGIVLVVLGSFFLLEQFDLVPFLSIHKLWPVIFIIIGVGMVFTGKDKTPKPIDDATEKKDEFKADFNEASNNPEKEQ